MSLEQSEIEKIAQEPEFIRAFEEVLIRLSTFSQGESEIALPEKREEIRRLIKSLEGEDSNAAKIFELRWLSGKSIEDAAQLTGLSSKEAEIKWKYAKAWIQSFMNQQDL